MADNPSIKKYKLLCAVRGKNFNTTNLSQYHLSIHVSGASFKVSCVNAVTTQCLLLETYALVYRHPYQRLHAIKQLYQDHTLLAGSWSAITLCIDNQQYTLVPKELVQEKKLADYLGFTCLMSGKTTRHFTHPSLNMTVIFAIDSGLLSWFQEIYNHSQLYTIHQASSLIQSIWTYLRDNKPCSLPKVLVFVASNYLHITVIQKNELLYYNRFEYASSDKLLYYILVVMRTLNLDTNLHEVMLGGHITKGSLAHKKARNYIRKLTFISTLPYLKFGDILSKETMRTHLDVLSAHLCHLTPAER
jgi:Protein of unknown function (DUF3822)